MKKQTLTPPSLFNATQYGFSQVVVTEPGRHVFISGQVAWDAQENLIGGDDLAKQTQQAMDNLETAIKAAGGSLENIVMLRIYKVDYQQGDGQIISQVLRESFGTENPPASTWVSVKGLANEGFMIEIEAQAVI